MITANYNTFVKSAVSGGDSYKALPFDTIDPEVYKTRSDRYELVRTILSLDPLQSKVMQRSGVVLPVHTGVLLVLIVERKFVSVRCVKVNRFLWRRKMTKIRH